MNSPGHWQCNECGPLPFLHRTPDRCPICGRKDISFVSEPLPRRPQPVPAERAAEEFRKMRELINQTKT